MSTHTTHAVPVITLDGPAGVGKGTMAIRLAAQLGWPLLDSGAIYRVLAYAAQQAGMALDDAPALAALGESLDLRFVPGNDEVRVWLHGNDITAGVRAEATGNAASQVAAIPAVRAALLQRQRDFRQAPGLVADGRDMGTVVFPGAPLKFFLTASQKARAERRYNQLKEKGISVNLPDLLRDLAARDARDSARQTAPMQAAADAHVIDTTNLGIDEVFAVLCGYLPGVPNL